MIDTKEARKLASDWAIPDGDIRNLLEDACDELDRLYVMEVEHRTGAADECDDAVEELLERMVEAYVGYQSPVDRGLAQQVEGMRLALNIWLAATPQPQAQVPDEFLNYIGVALDYLLNDNVYECKEVLRRTCALLAANMTSREELK